MANWQQPALTPLLFVVHRQFLPDLQRSPVARQGYLERLASTVGGNVFVAIFSIYVLSSWSLLGFAVSLGTLAGSFITYGTLLQRRVKDDSPIPPLNLERDMATVLSRTIAAVTVALAVQTMVFGFTSGDAFPTVLLGITKALSWYFTTRTVSH